MFRLTLIVGALCLALLSPLSPAYAQECFTLAQAVDALEGDASPYVVVDEPDAVKALVEMIRAATPTPDGDPTRVIVTVISGVPAYGFEIGGCMTPPYQWPEGVPFPLGSNG